MNRIIIFYCFFALSPLVIRAQEILKNGTQIVYFDSLYNFVDNRAKATYYIIITRSDNKISNPCTDYYMSGKKHWTGNVLTCENNVFVTDGLCSWYDENGNKTAQVTMSSNMFNGKYYEWWPNGNLKEESNFVNGNKDGCDFIWDENGYCISGNLIVVDDEYKQNPTNPKYKINCTCKDRTVAKPQSQEVPIQKESVQPRKKRKVRPHTTFGFEGGLNVANFIYGTTSTGDNITTDAVSAGRFGIILDIPVHGVFYIQPGIFYAMNGATNNAENNTWRLNTIELPINFMFKSGNYCSTHFFIGLGPFVGYNISGTYSYYTSGNLNIGSDPTDDLKALDIGIGINVGIESKGGLIIRLRYQEGLTNLQPQTDAIYPSINSSSYGAQLGILFGKKHRHRMN